MENKLKIKTAEKICKKIAQQYNLLDANCSIFFNQYHDNLMTQRDCAFDDYYEMVDCIENNKYLDTIDSYIENLQDTLNYCVAVIKLQEYTKKLPEPIYC